ncbi:MAG: hypothetical protein ACRDNL_14525 [Spirillospora sp.]
MKPDNVWLAGRLQEQDALGRIILKIEQVQRADGTVKAVRGARGHRPHRCHRPRPGRVIVSRGNPENLRSAVRLRDLSAWWKRSRRGAGRRCCRVPVLKEQVLQALQKLLPLRADERDRLRERR